MPQCSAAALARNAVPDCAIDSTRPALRLRYPASGATGAARDARPAVTFSEPVRGVRASTMRLRDLTAGAWVTATVSYNGSTRRATLAPARLLATAPVPVVSLDFDHGSGGEPAAVDQLDVHDEP